MLRIEKQKKEKKTEKKTITQEQESK